MRRVENDMSFAPLLTAREQDTLVDAWGKMHRARVRHLPVLDDKNRVVGVLSDRDILKASHADPEHHKTFGDLGETLDIALKVKDYMTWPVRSIAPDESLTSAVRLMIDEKISSLLVKDAEENTYTGIITVEDLLRVLMHYLKKDSGEEASFLRIRHVIHNSPVGWVADELSTTGI
jgi:acetoin utilization protein AcuB